MCTSASPALAVVFCDADSCFLCAACDEQVHEANRLAQRHVRRPVSPVDIQPASEELDILVPDVDSANVSLSRDSTLLEDAVVAYTDFDDFESVTFGKMPCLNASDSDSAFLSIVPSAGLKAFDSELSWEAVVPEEFEHVVPDIETMNASAVVKPHVVSAVKSDSSGANVSINSNAAVPAWPVVPVSTGRAPAVCKLSSVKAMFRQDPSTFSEVNLPESSTLSSSGAMAVMESSTERDGLAGSSSVGKSELPLLPGTDSTSSLELEPSSEEGCAAAARRREVDVEVKTDEQRKQLRAEALVRFRAKRANRSFRKKIRYGCRKVLAESRPRVKGRFVKKCDMALYALHGADYAKFKLQVFSKHGADVTMEQVDTSI